MSDDCKKESVISKQTRVTVGMVLVIVGIAVFTARSSIYAEEAKSKVKTLEQTMKKLAQAQVKIVQTQIKLTSTTNTNQKKSDENGQLLRKLSEVQIQQQLILNTQKVELKYIKRGVETMLKRGG